MTEPASAAAGGVATAGLIWLFGPSAPGVALIVAAAMAGACHSAGKRSTSGVGAFVGHVLLWTVTAALFTGAASWALTQYTGIPAERWPGCVAFLISFLAHRWGRWLDRFFDVLPGARSGLGKGTEP